MADAANAATTASATATSDGATAAAAASAAVLSLDHEVFMVQRGTPTKGHIRLNSRGLAFKAKGTGKRVNVYQQEMLAARWMRVARGYELRITQKSGVYARFDGFRRSDKQSLHDFFVDELKMPLTTVEIAVNGLNWGDVVFAGSALSFIDGSSAGASADASAAPDVFDSQPIAFELPLNAVSNVTNNKQDVTLEFHEADNLTAVGDHDQTLESMKFTVAPHPDDEIPHLKAEEFVEQVKAARALWCQVLLDLFAPRGHVKLSQGFLRVDCVRFLGARTG